MGPVLRRPTAILGIAVILGTVVGSLAAPLLAPYDPTEMQARGRFAQPGLEFLLGTDEAGLEFLLGTDEAGLAIFRLVWSFNMLGDALRDGLDPRLRTL